MKFIPPHGTIMVTRQKRALFVHFSPKQIPARLSQKIYENKITNLVAVVLSAFNELLSFCGTSFNFY